LGVPATAQSGSIARAELGAPRADRLVRDGQAPLGQKLLGEVIDYAKTHNALPAKTQDEQFATRAPALPA